MWYAVRIVRAELISIGTELASGLALDTNSAWLAGELARLGVEVTRHVTVTDDRPAIAAELDRAAGSAGIVLVTGGLGPTDDDVTREALADAMGVPLRTDQASLEQVRAFFVRLGRRFAESNTRQARFPEGAAPIENPWGTAPGCRARLGEATVYCLPGVPREMKEMFRQAVAPDLRTLARGAVIVTRTLRCFGAGESTIGDQIADLMAAGRPVTVGITAAEGLISIRLITEARDETTAETLLAQDEADLRRRLGVLIYGTEDQTLASVVGDLLRQGQHTVATAESCTGGLLAKHLTDVPGSSAYLLGGLVTYSNRGKSDLLGVDPLLIERHGAVSEEVARQMAAGCRERTGADFVLSTTGIAGPGGGTPEKPVGLVYIALARDGGAEVKRYLLGSQLPRSSIRERTCATALNMLRLRLQ